MRILVVDNYAPFARSLRLMLAPEHEAVVCISGKEALALLSAEKFDRVLCDLDMPGMSGIELFHALPESERRMVVFMTGGAQSAAAREFLATVTNAVLEKPFRADELRAALR